MFGILRVDQTEGDHTDALRRSYPTATTIPIAITASVASKLPGAIRRSGNRQVADTMFNEGRLYATGAIF